MERLTCGVSADVRHVRDYRYSLLSDGSDYAILAMPVEPAADGSLRPDAELHAQVVSGRLQLRSPVDNRTMHLQPVSQR